MAQASKVVIVDKPETFKQRFTDAKLSHAVLFFWVDWHEPCKVLSPVIEQLSLDHPHLPLLSINAESNSDVSESFNISSVPTIIFCKNSQEIERYEAVSTPDLVSAVSKFSKQAATQQKLLPSSNNNNNNNASSSSSSSASGANANENDSKAQESEEERLNKRLAKLVNAAPIMLFMKGEPNNPRCKFSRAMIEVLKEQNVGKFGYFDILTDDSVRQGFKTFSNWKTYPQLYINGKLLGGLDVVKEMIEEDEFKDALPKVRKETENELNERLEKLINKSDVMLFMKGSPTEPMCGFSNKIVGLLKEQNVEFGYFNILEDDRVRQGLKKYSNWPTYPQLYSKGKLLGGLDIIQEMIDEGEFKEALQ